MEGSETSWIKLYRPRGKPHRFCARGKPRGCPIIYWMDKMARDRIGQVHGLPSLKDSSPRSALLNITIPTAPGINSGKETRLQGHPLPSKHILQYRPIPPLRSLCQKLLHELSLAYYPLSIRNFARASLNRTFLTMCSQICTRKGVS
jgi:hypothetical protein